MKRKILILFLVLLSIISNLYAENTRDLKVVSSEKRFALLIGVDKYSRPVDSLKYCVKDMELLKETLIETGFPNDNITLLTDGNATGSKIKGEIQNICELMDETDLLIVAFSGHGVTLNEKAYLCPFDLSMTSSGEVSPDSLVSRDLIYEELDKCRAHRKLFFIDACRSNLTQGTKSLGGARTLSDPTGGGSHGFVLMASCDVGQASWELDELGHGAFTWFLCQGMKGEAKDSDGQVSVFSLAGFVSNRTKRHVYKKFGLAQVPTFKQSGEMTDFLLVDKSLKVVPAPEPEPESEPKSEPKTAKPNSTNSFASPSSTPGSVSGAGQGLGGYLRENKGKVITAIAIILSVLIVIVFISVKTARPTRQTVPTVFAEEPVVPKAGDKKTQTIKGIDYAFRWCPPGTFMMGSPEGEEDHQGNEIQHSVTLTKGFWMLEHEVTQAMWESVMGENPSWFSSAGGGKDKISGSTAQYPVERVSWEDCQKFIEKIQGSAPNGLKFSLPSEAQWEYACRAGTTTPFNFGSVLKGDKANCDVNYPYGTNTKDPYLGKTTPVKSYAPNAWGLYDMHGNVWEWCEDWYDKDYYKNSPATDPTGPESGSERVDRGGGWISNAGSCRSAVRYRHDPSDRDCGLGFRLALLSSTER